MREHEENGQFKRIRREPWTPARWNDGYIDNNGRFRVYRPDYPRAYAMGYALRYHVVWWLHHGEPHPEGTNLHHINEDKLDDKLENLECLDHAEHVSLHRRIEKLTCCCNNCDNTLQETPNRVYNYGRGKFCSQNCLHAYRAKHGMKALQQVEVIVI